MDQDCLEAFAKWWAHQRLNVGYWILCRDAVMAYLDFERATRPPVAETGTSNTVTHIIWKAA